MRRKTFWLGLQTRSPSESARIQRIFTLGSLYPRFGLKTMGGPHCTPGDVTVGGLVERL